MDLKKLVGKNIKNLRKLKKWTQAELAEKAGVEPITIARIETGQSFPKEENLVNLAKLLDVEVSTLFILKTENEGFNRESALNYIHYNIHALSERDLKILCSMIEAMSLSV